VHLLHPAPQEKRLQDKKTSCESPLCGKYRYGRFVLVLAGVIGTASFHVHYSHALPIDGADDAL